MKSVDEVLPFDENGIDEFMKGEIKKFNRLKK